MSSKKKRRADIDSTPSYMTFDPHRGYVWGPAHEHQGQLPYWNTGKPATWRADAKN